MDIVFGYWIKNKINLHTGNSNFLNREWNQISEVDFAIKFDISSNFCNLDFDLVSSWNLFEHTWLSNIDFANVHGV